MIGIVKKIVADRFSEKHPPPKLREAGVYLAGS